MDTVKVGTNDELYYISCKCLGLENFSRSCVCVCVCVCVRAPARACTFSVYTCKPISFNEATFLKKGFMRH